MKRLLPSLVVIALALGLMPAAFAQEKQPWVVYTGPFGTGAGMHIVLISGDPEFRSEEAMPQLGKILAKHHGFKCTVLFAIDPKTGAINPKVMDNIPGLESLKTADLMIIAAGKRTLPEAQMKRINDYLESGKPILGLRPALGAFEKMEGQFAKYNNSAGKDFEGGFGRQILGEKWLDYHGTPGMHSTRGVIHPSAIRHPVHKVYGPSTNDTTL